MQNEPSSFSQPSFTDAIKSCCAHAVLDTAQLAERAGRLKVEIRQLSDDTVRYQNDLDAYRASHPPMS